MRAKGVYTFVGLAPLLLVSTISIGQLDTETGVNKTEAAAPAVADNGGEIEIKKVSQSLAHQTIYQVSRSVGKGRMVKHQTGQPGKVVETYRVLKRDGKVIKKELLGKERIEPKHTIYLMGHTGYQTSRGSFDRKKVMVMNASAYDPSAGRGSRATFRTATGMRARYGLVAVDPRVIPLGTMVFVEGYGMALAADTGGAIKGNKIDLCMNTRAECIRFGRRKVKVHILK
jgi:3D (Asp-Asp-Asp) domain-containing protein